MSDKLELGTKQDLEMLISELDNFYSYRGRFEELKQLEVV